MYKQGVLMNNKKFWNLQKKKEVKEKFTGFNKKNLFDQDGTIIDPRLCRIKTLKGG